MILKPLPFSLRPTKVLLSIGKMDKKDNLNFRGSAEKIIRNNEYIPEKNIKEIQPCDMVSSQTQFEALPRVVSLPYRNITRFNVFGRKSEVYPRILIGKPEACPKALYGIGKSERGN